eukprot:SAG22_NODE_1182_length_5233_cov_12.254188_10_plen_65_part_01
MGGGGYLAGLGGVGGEGLVVEEETPGPELDTVSEKSSYPRPPPHQMLHEPEGGVIDAEWMKPNIA